MNDKAGYIIYNGNFVKAENPVLSHRNRAFCFGDALFETMFAYQDKVRFFPEHFQRLCSGLRIFKMNLPNNFDAAYFHQEIIRLMKKNRLYKGVRVRLTVFRIEGGFYTPESNEISYIIETNHLDSIYYGVQAKGLRIGLYTDYYKPDFFYNKYKTGNSAFSVLAGIFKKENGFDDCILLNQKQNVVEAISSNIFLVRKGKIFTPPLSDGCVDGIMRKQIIRIADKKDFEVIDNESINTNDLLTADEIFLSNAVSGIQWVLAYERKRYFHDISAQILELLNAEIKP